MLTAELLNENLYLAKNINPGKNIIILFANI
jgi:hypothetical protein